MSIDTTKTISAVRYNGVSIPLAGGGGGGSYTGKKVTFIDYDGTILKQEYVAAGATVSLPTAPSHEGLTFSGWASPLQTKSDIATAGSVTVGNTDLIVGALYNTSATKLIFQLPQQAPGSVELTIGFATTVYPATVDWGDGMGPQPITGSTINHMYSYPFPTTPITVTLADGTYPAGSGYVLGTVAQMWQGSLLGAIISDGCVGLVGESGAMSSSSGTFYGQYNLQYCLLSDVERPTIMNSSSMMSEPAIRNSAFAYCYALKTLIFPDDNSVQGDILTQVRGIKYITYTPRYNYASGAMGESRTFPAITQEAMYDENSYPSLISYISEGMYGSMIMGIDTLDFSNTQIVGMSQGSLAISRLYKTTTIIMPNLQSVSDNLNYQHSTPQPLTSVTLIDFRALTSMPTYGGSSENYVINTSGMGSYMPILNQNLKIVVPDSLYNDFMDSPNHREWSNVTQYIVRASDYTA